MGTVTIPLTRGQVAYIDEDDLPRVSLYKWYANWNVTTKSYYARGYVVTEDGKRKMMYMHRFLMNNPVGFVVDHINRNSLDNREENLRVCTQADNSKNKRIKSENTSGHTGVCFDNTRGRWLAQLSSNGNRILSERFPTKEEAVRAYEKAAAEHHREFSSIQAESEVPDRNVYFDKWDFTNLDVSANIFQKIKSEGKLILPECIVEIPMSRGQTAYVDITDYELVNNYKWTASWSTSTESFYAITKETVGIKKQKTIKMHRLIMGAKEGEVVDHTLGFTNYNVRSNLRICTVGENNYNHKLRKDNKTGFRGVSLIKHDKFLAAIKKDGVLIKLGTFPTPEEAHEAYCKASKELHGEFGRAQ
jgi:hypothetical protein